MFLHYLDLLELIHYKKISDPKKTRNIIATTSHAEGDISVQNIAAYDRQILEKGPLPRRRLMRVGYQRY